MTGKPVILLIGTVDTKSDEIGFLRDSIERCGGSALVMDVGVLGRGAVVPDIANAQVAEAAQTSLQAIIDSGDENVSMQWLSASSPVRVCLPPP